MRLTVPATLAVVLLAQVAAARGADVVPRAVLLRMEGHVGPRRDGDRGVAEISMRHDKTTLQFQLNEIWVLSGDVASHDVLSEIEPYTPSLSVAGPPEVVDRLVSARPEAMLEGTGYFRRGARIFMLSG